MNNNHFIADIPLKALIEKDGKILFVMGADDDYYQLPGGRLNNGEDLRGGLRREIKEELYLDIEPKDIFEAFSFQSSSGLNHLVIVYRCDVIGGIENMKFQDGEIKEVKWVSSLEFDNIKMRDEYRVALKKFFLSV